jgi:hypothetical protein
MLLVMLGDKRKEKKKELLSLGVFCFSRFWFWFWFVAHHLLGKMPQRGFAWIFELIKLVKGFA